MLVDSHCHIPMIEYEGGADAVIDSARANGVGHMLCVSIDLDSWPEIMDLAERHECISASVGIHPNSRVSAEPAVEELAGLAGNTDIVAIGETGLDYYRSQGDLDWQRERFRTHIRCARQVKKPLIIHSRETGGDVIKLLQQESAAECGGVMHCFVDDWETAKQAMDLNFYISFSGIVTFKNAAELKDVARKVPLDMMLIETDSPYLAPVPHRGKRNEPAFVRHVAGHIAELRGVDLETIAEATTANFFRLFPEVKKK